MSKPWWREKMPHGGLVSVVGLVAVMLVLIGTNTSHGAVSWALPAIGPALLGAGRAFLLNTRATCRDN